MAKAGYVYMMASRPNGTLYIGVTSDLVGRVFGHREGVVRGFTKRLVANGWCGSKRTMICRMRGTASSR